MSDVDGSADLSGERVQMKRFSVPDFEEPELYYDYNVFISDYEDIEALEKASVHARIALQKVTEEINRVERELAEAKLKKERAYRRIYLASDEKPETARKFRAELKTEKYDDVVIVKEQYKSELSRLANTYRIELQSLQAAGNNLRQQMKL